MKSFSLALIAGLALAQNCARTTTRKEINDVTEDEWNAIVETIKTAQRTRDPNSRSGLSIWEEAARVHNQLAPQIHWNCVFFPWHRLFLSDMERKLQAINPNFFFPYWDSASQWATADSSIVWTKLGRNGNPVRGDIFGGQRLRGHDDTALKRGWTTLNRRLISRETYNEQYQLSLRQGGFEAWSQELEVLHGTVHIQVGLDNGQMSGMFSPLDPMFYLHHAHMDYLWSNAQAGWRTNNLPLASQFNGVNAEGLRCSGTTRMPGYMNDFASVIDNSNLCVRYANPREVTPPPPASTSSAIGTSTVTTSSAIPTLSSSTTAASSSISVRPSSTIIGSSSAVSSTSSAVSTSSVRPSSSSSTVSSTIVPSSSAVSSTSSAVSSSSVRPSTASPTVSSTIVPSSSAVSSTSSAVSSSSIQPSSTNAVVSSTSISSSSMVSRTSSAVPSSSVRPSSTSTASSISTSVTTTPSSSARPSSSTTASSETVSSTKTARSSSVVPSSIATTSTSVVRSSSTSTSSSTAVPVASSPAASTSTRVSSGLSPTLTSTSTTSVIPSTTIVPDNLVGVEFTTVTNDPKATETSTPRPIANYGYGQNYTKLDTCFEPLPESWLAMNENGSTRTNIKEVQQRLLDICKQTVEKVQRGEEIQPMPIFHPDDKPAIGPPSPVPIVPQPDYNVMSGGSSNYALTLLIAALIFVLQ